MEERFFLRTSESQLRFCTRGGKVAACCIVVRWPHRRFPLKSMQAVRPAINIASRLRIPCHRLATSWENLCCPCLAASRSDHVRHR
ncbi:hypothetical protein GDO78_021864 [Eleutherodactylus coqui]|uniref:Uncharacterized protein n=1 Tax=Eleutherodactylus coqui TaxID=57060 RepID=A0A8J6BCI6_ELECQ|nr:hypothetical protein GDO78_021864 [Eleutherodactylus coqui]